MGSPHPPPSREEIAAFARRAFRETGLALPDPIALEALTRHLAELYRWNARINLTAIRDPRVGVRRHLVESWEGVLALREAGVGEGGLLVDLGSGNGYPALGILAGFPTWRGVLYESVGRKTDFLRSTIQRLGWTDRVEVRQERVQQAAQLPTADVFSFRAFPRPDQWSVEILGTRPSATLLAWLAAQDARRIGALLQDAGGTPHILPLRSHREGALLLGRGSSRSTTP
ncbi:MAG: class I SAM-dependent methyltransferase [Acidobacteriota bacterium]|nr:class I SAM-dependent methyltransferase [Acidobacteriota bacterium]MDQ7087064.1 class I SAM-dependent methyltransferase [Acidobacteriota bacterium]